ncbi:MAG: DNA helicase II [Gammaproteobacteria bacterium]|nr:DNA helicase II [Gammaproteobacteria bacterium]
MDVTHILSPLNDAQRDAVTCTDPHALILAGAGSGKTRVLVHRIAWLMATGEAMGHNILAVTFTNKAAGEMRMRIEEMLMRPVGGMWVGTFHGLAHRLLRAHAEEAGLADGFQIIDSDDQLRAVRRLVREMDLDEARWQPRQVQGFINSRKEEGLRAKHVDPGGDWFAERMLEVYQQYEALCERGGLVDFAELLLRAHEVLRDRPDVLAHYQHRFRYVLVDEFQDTNAIQYAWLRLMAGSQAQLFCVGDDDQSIYGWRGARIENIHQFSKDYSGVATFRLEQNYRSTGNILGAANGLIANNQGRLGKDLWTADGTGEPVRRYSAFNEVDEARFVVGRIVQWKEQGGRGDECAILYRVSAQSRMFEEALLANAVPYRVYGGMRFYERAEIKDALAYMRLIGNPNDDTALERAINTPTRGIGTRTVEVLRDRARMDNTSLWDGILACLAGNLLSARAAGSVRGFVQLMDELRSAVRGLELYEQVRTVTDLSGLVEFHGKEKGERGVARVENLNELVAAARQFAFEIEEGDDPLIEFLAHAALEAGDEQASDAQDAVNLMTLHSAKGLEFPQVFLTGLEEGLFPHQRSMEDASQLEEERRLCYVGMTRAKQALYLTYAEARRLRGSEYYATPSRFLHELPDEHVEDVRLGRPASPGRTRPAAPVAPTWSAATQEEGPGGIQLGQRVAHKKFGEGMVTKFEGHGNHARVQVNFNDHGAKWLIVAYAKLEAV